MHEPVFCPPSVRPFNRGTSDLPNWNAFWIKRIPGSGSGIMIHHYRIPDYGITFIWRYKAWCTDTPIKLLSTLMVALYRSKDMDFWKQTPLPRSRWCLHRVQRQVMARKSQHICKSIWTRRREKHFAKSRGLRKSRFSISRKREFITPSLAIARYTHSFSDICYGVAL